VGEAVARAKPDAIVHQMTSLSGTPDFRHFDRWFAETNRLRTEGTHHLLAAAHATGVGIFVAQSYTGWPSGTGRGLSTESDPFDPNPVRWQRESLAAIRELEQAVTNAPLTGIVLRYGNLYGPGATDPMVAVVKKRMLPIIGGGTAITNWTHVDDAAGATLAALEKPVRGVYNVVDDDPAPVAEWLPLMAKLSGARPPMHIPTWLGRLLGGDATVRFMTETRGSSNAKMKRTFGWSPRWPSWREGFRHGLVESPSNARRAA
jgi:nucleoside-diphosphate-sugar epimerase